MSSLSRDQKKTCEEVFELFDKNRDGSIDARELGMVIRAAGGNPTEEDIQDVLKEYDINKNGKIEFNEFLTYYEAKYREPDSEEELKSAFKVFDKDGNGFIDKDELMNVVTTLGEPLSPEEADEMIRDADTNRDGRIDYKEFVKFILSNQ